MIKNIIFDLGNVLIEYSPERFISEFVEEKNQDRFYKRVFKEQEWQDLDRGTLEYDEAIKIFTKDLPEEKENIEKLDVNIAAMLNMKLKGRCIVVSGQTPYIGVKIVDSAMDTLREVMKTLQGFKDGNLMEQLKSPVSGQN